MIMIAILFIVALPIFIVKEVKDRKRKIEYKRANSQWIRFFD